MDDGRMRFRRRRNAWREFKLVTARWATDMARWDSRYRTLQRRERGETLQFTDILDQEVWYAETCIARDFRRQIWGEPFVYTGLRLGRRTDAYNQLSGLRWLVKPYEWKTWEPK